MLVNSLVHVTVLLSDLNNLRRGNPDLNCEVKWFRSAATREYTAPKVSDSDGVGGWP